MNLVIEMITKKFEEKVIFDGASFQFQKGKILKDRFLLWCWGQQLNLIY